LSSTEEQFYNIVNEVNGSMPDIMQILGKRISEQWKELAKEGERWGSKYAKAIKYKVEGTTVDVYLDEGLIDKGSKKPYFMFAMMMEQGVKSWSIKDALLASEKAKTSKDGIKYMVVPFPVSTPRKAGQGTMQNKFGKREMTREMYNIVKSGGKLKTGTVNAYGKDVDVSGLVKYQTRQLHSQFGIFRAVSEKSSGWQYPNVEADPVFPQVLAEVNNQIRDLLTDYCRAVVKKYSD